MTMRSWIQRAVAGVAVAGWLAAASAQTVHVPARGTEAAYTMNVYWACNGSTVPVRAAADAGASALPSAPMLNGRYYRECTGKERFADYGRDTFGPRALLGSAVRAGIEQYRTVPTGWGQDAAGYGQRYGSAFGESAINNSVRYGMAAVLHEDVRYLVCHKCSVHDKLQNAGLSEFTARHGADGHRRFSVTPLVAGFSGPLIAYTAWYPPGYEPGEAARHALLGFGTRVGFRVVREFLLDRDTKAEKAAKASAADVAATK